MQYIQTACVIRIACTPADRYRGAGGSRSSMPLAGVCVERERLIPMVHCTDITAAAGDGVRHLVQHHWCSSMKGGSISEGHRTTRALGV